MSNGTDRYGADRYHQLAALRAKGSVVWVPDLMTDGAYAVTGYDECRSLLVDKRFGRQALKAMPASVVQTLPPERLDQERRRQKAMSFNDPPDHTRMRAAFAPAFTAAAVEKHAERVQRIADSLVSDLMRGNSADLVADYAATLPLTVLSEVLGLPSEDLPQIKSWALDLIAGLDPAAARAVPVHRLLAEVDGYIEGLIAGRRPQPGDDVISLLMNEPHGLSTAEVVANLRGLIIAGHETTCNLIANGMLHLLSRPELAGVAVTDNALDELLRFDGPLQATHRFAYGDVELGGTVIPQGSAVVAVLGAANRDPAVFADPDRLVLDRPNAHRHLAFATGAHYCLGASLAKLEARIAINTLRRRLPAMTLTDDRPQWKDSFNLRALHTLRVSWK